MSEQKWNEKYVFRDGLHPNQLGHEYIVERVMKELSNHIQDKKYV